MKKKKRFKSYVQGEKKLNALFEKEFLKHLEHKERKKIEKNQHFQRLQISDDESKNNRGPSLVE